MVKPAKAATGKAPALRPAPSVASEHGPAAPIAVPPRVRMMDDSPRGRILRTAAHLFLTQGFARTTVRDLAREVGIQSGSLFHHFSSKEEILEAVMTEVSLSNTERMLRVAALECEPLQRVHALVRCELESIHGETSEAMTLLAVEWRSLSKEAKKRVLVLRDNYERIWIEALTEAQAYLLPLEPLLLRKLLLGMTSGTATWYRPRGSLSLEALTAAICAALSRRAH